MSESKESPVLVKEKTQSIRKVSPVPDISRWPSTYLDNESSFRFQKYQSSMEGESIPSSRSNRSDYMSVDKISRAISTIVPDYYEVQENHMPEGDMPLPDGFANTFTFWKVLLIACVLGLAMGTVGICFVNIVDEVIIMI